MAVQQKTAEALAELVTDEVPESLVNQEMQQRLEDSRHAPPGPGLPASSSTSGLHGQDQESFVQELRESAAQGVKVDLALRAVAEAEELDVSDEELEDEYASVAERVGQKPAQVRKQLERNGQVLGGTLRSAHPQGPRMAHRARRTGRRGGQSDRSISLRVDERRH